MKKLRSNLFRTYKRFSRTLISSDTKLKEKYLNYFMKKRLGYGLYDLQEGEETFNQKVQYRKLFDKNPLFKVCADKYEVREYVSNKIGDEYLIPLHVETAYLTEEQWVLLPSKFVAKANHNSGPVQVVKDKVKVNYSKVSKELHRQLKEPYGTISLESYYDNIKPRIIIEKFLEDKDGKIPSDYKFHCFNRGNEVFIQLDSDRYETHKQDFFDEYWNRIDLQVLSPNSKENISPPENLLELVKIARKLADDFDYVRVDLYNLDGKIYFGELTFCPWGGLTKFKQKKWDIEWGRLWKQGIIA